MATIPATVPGEWQCTNEEYHGDTEFVSRSALAEFYDCKPRYHGMYVTGTIERKAPTKQMLTGSLSHIFILEPDRLSTDVVVIPPEVLAKNGARSTNAYHEFAAKHSGKLLVKAEELATAKEIVDAVRRDEIVRKFRLLQGGVCERTIVWQDQETGLMCKSRQDYRKPKLLVDIKTTEDTRPAAFSRKAADQGYYFQDAFYCDGEEAVTGERPEFMFIVVSTKPPYQVACHALNPEFRRIGAEHVRKALNELANCLETDDWRDDHQKQINELSPPYFLANSSRWEITQ